MMNHPHHVERKKFWPPTIGLLVIGILAGLNHVYSERRAPQPDQTHSSSLSSQLPLADEGSSDKLDTADSTMKSSTNLDAQPPKGGSRMAGIEFLETKYGVSVHVDQDLQSKPFTLIANLKTRQAPNELESNFKSRLIQEVAAALEIDQPEQIGFATQAALPIGWVYNYDQTFEKVRVDGAQVRIHFSNQGDVILVNSSYIPDIKNVNTTPRIQASEAVKFALLHSIENFDPAQKRIADPNPKAELVIHVYRTSGRPDLAWKIPIMQPWLGHEHGSSHYFVNAHSGEIERVEIALN